MDTRRQVRVYLNDREYASALAESALRGQSVSGFLRHCLHKEAAEAKQTRQFLTRQLAGQTQFEYATEILGASDNTETERSTGEKQPG